MARPQRKRKICGKPEFCEFSPDALNASSAGEPEVVLTLDEFEVIRLVDFEEQTHEQCAKQMEISRPTVTEIYKSARRKIADSLVNGRHLVISGGNYRLCDGISRWCCKKECDRYTGRRRLQGQSRQTVESRKGENNMKVAVTYENGEIFQHFGHTGQFKFYELEDGRVVSSEILDTNGSGHGALAGFLAENQTDVLICGGIGGGAQAALAKAGIKLYGGVSGNADEAVQALAAGTLAFQADVHCEHHDHEHGGEGHTCGEHGCGKHDCR